MFSQVKSARAGLGSLEESVDQLWSRGNRTRINPSYTVLLTELVVSRVGRGCGQRKACVDIDPGCWTWFCRWSGPASCGPLPSLNLSSSSSNERVWYSVSWSWTSLALPQSQWLLRWGVEDGALEADLSLAWSYSSREPLCVWVEIGVPFECECGDECQHSSMDTALFVISCLLPTFTHCVLEPSPPLPFPPLLSPSFPFLPSLYFL